MGQGGREGGRERGMEGWEGERDRVRAIFKDKLKRERKRSLV